MNEDQGSDLMLAFALMVGGAGLFNWAGALISAMLGW